MTSSEIARAMAVLASVLSLASGCLSKGDTNVAFEGDAGDAEDPTCLEVCGRVTANDTNWMGCGELPADKDTGRQVCLDRCRALAPDLAALRCAVRAANCSELASCPPVF